MNEDQNKMETIFHSKPYDPQKVKLRLDLIKHLANELHSNFVFKDTLNFNFLLHLFSSKIEDLYNHAPEMSDGDFQERIQLLDQSLHEMKDYVIE